MCEIINITSNEPKYPLCFFLFYFIKSALIWNEYKKFGGGYFCPKRSFFLFWKIGGQFYRIRSYFDPLNQISLWIISDEIYVNWENNWNAHTLLLVTFQDLGMAYCIMLLRDSGMDVWTLEFFIIKPVKQHNMVNTMIDF